MNAELIFTDYGPAVRVNEPGNQMPWEFAVRGAAIRTPMRERVTLAGAIAYVRRAIAERDAALVTTPKHHPTSPLYNGEGDDKFWA